MSVATVTNIRYDGDGEDDNEDDDEDDGDIFSFKVVEESLREVIEEEEERGVRSS